MFKIYYASAIDTCVEEAFKQIEKFKKIFSKYEYNCSECIFLEDTVDQIDKCKKCHKLEVYGAGFGESPIIGPDTSPVYKGVVSAYDFRQIRQCDVLLVVTDLKQFAAGTMMELEYARNLGIYIIVLVVPWHREFDRLGTLEKVKNIFLETYANKILYSIEELEEILKELTQ